MIASNFRNKVSNAAFVATRPKSPSQEGDSGVGNKFMEFYDRNNGLAVLFIFFTFAKIIISRENYDSA